MTPPGPTSAYRVPVPGRTAHLVDPEGQSFAVGERLIIGRSRDADLVVHSGRVDRRHVVLVRLPSGDVEAEDLATTTGTRLNGAPLAHRVLADGDVLELDDHPFVFHLGPELPSPVDPMAAVLAQASDGEAALQVWVDALLEQGDPLGPRLAAGKRLPLAAPLSEAVREGTLELDWRGGFVRAARLRAQAFTVDRALLFALLASEAARFLDTLALPYLHPRFGLDGAALPALRELRFGPFFTAEDGARCTEALARAPFARAPFLQPPVVQQYARAWLEFAGGEQRRLEQGAQVTFPTSAVRWESGGWLVSRAYKHHSLLFNGRSRYTAFLTPGDEVSSGATRFVFRAS